MAWKRSRRSSWKKAPKFTRKARLEEGHHPYRWRLPRQPRPRRLGCGPRVWEAHAPRERWSARDHEQPHGIAGGGRRVDRAERTVRGGVPYRLELLEERYHRLASRMETQWLADAIEEAGEERRPLARAGCPGLHPQNQMALGERSCRS